jgi:hypothetical protein
MKNRFLLALVLLSALLPACASIETPTLASTSSVTSVAAASLPDSLGSPPALNLSDPALPAAFTSSVSQQRQLAYDGTDGNGAAIHVTDDVNYREQSEPAWASDVHHFYTNNNHRYGEIEISILNNINYAVENGKCTKAIEQNQRTPLYQQVTAVQELTGTANRVEVGKTMNGVQVDRYELNAENLRFRSGIIEFISGSLYRAREGGYLVHLEYSARVDPQFYTLIQDVFTPDKPTILKYRFDQTFTAAGALKIEIPAVCK